MQEGRQTVASNERSWIGSIVDFFTDPTNIATGVADATNIGVSLAIDNAIEINGFGVGAHLLHLPGLLLLAAGLQCSDIAWTATSMLTSRSLQH